MSDTEHLAHIRHSLAHLLAASVRELYPGAKNAIGPSVDDGFYQDFELPQPISDKDLGKIEQKMREKIKDWKLFERSEVTPEEAKKEFAWNEYKTELIEEFSKEGKKLTFYTVGGFVDLCKGGHVESPAKEIPKEAWKLDRVAGAYWRGDEKNKMLTRIYGLAFESKEALDAYVLQREEAVKRDHKKLGKELDLFTFSDLVGGGLPLWTPKGTLLRNILDGFVWELRKKEGYEQVEIPHITKKELYEKSGHWQKFKNELFRITTREKHEFAMKPMNCPHHTQIYARKAWSYRELPQRYATTTMVYRDEQSGELSGLSRVRSITQDDAHVFCRPDQVKSEMGKIWNIIEAFYGAVGFTLTPRLSLHDPKQMDKYLGTEEAWEKSENALRALVKERNVVATEAVGEAAFYGPKVDFMAKDSIGRQWQVATIQLDSNMPERFELEFVNEKSEKERVVMIHAAIMGSIERYLSIIIEHFAGAFPLWLSPVQVKILPVGEKFLDYAKTVHEALQAAAIRSELDTSNETLGKKVRSAKVEKVPYWIVVGAKEETEKTVTLESRSGTKETLPLNDLASRLTKEIKEKN
ncbi:MAG: threonine--tRNA ligase [bacterium]|nr:threonine--tRNA ligase [bacterium]